MPIKVFEVSKGQLKDVSDGWVPPNSNGWYNTVKAADLNHDGLPDLLVGNHGLNTRFHASEAEPLELLVSDFDNNGSYEQVISMYSQGRQYPFAQLKELASQVPSVAQMFTSFKDYQLIETSRVFPPESMAKGYRLQTFNLASGVFLNTGKQLIFEKLPLQAQFAPMYALTSDDFDGDGNMDIIMGGNFSQSKPEVGTYQASYGVTLKGNGQGNFKFVPNWEAGYKMEGDARDVEIVRIENKKVLIFTRNNRETYMLSYYGS